MQDANGLEVHRNRVRPQFIVKLIAEDDDVFESFGQWEPIAVSVIPDRRFTEEVKPCGMDHFRGAQLGIRFEEDRRTEYPFERRDQPSILFSAPSAIRTFPASRLRIENGW